MMKYSLWSRYEHLFSVVGGPEDRTILTSAHADGVLGKCQFSVTVPVHWSTPGDRNV